MAADVGQRFSGWTCSDAPYNDHSSQDPSVQQMVIDHGSVSFGRFAAEPLSWEKRSVFAHNSRQEELRKLTAPGLVAQKKAFFEEYYKSARYLKARRAVQQTQATSDDANGENIHGRRNQEEEEEEDQLPAVVSDDPVTSAPSSSFECSTVVSSSYDRKCQDSHEVGYLTFNPLFSQTAGLQNIQQEERSSACEKQYLDRDFPCAMSTSSNLEHIGEDLDRKVLAPRQVVSNVNGENNVAQTRIILPKASLQSEDVRVAHEKKGARNNATLINRPMKRSKDLTTSVIHIPRIDFRRNSENRPSQELKDPFHKRVEMKLRALSDRMSADKAGASSRSASYQPPDRVMTTCKSSCQNADKLANSSRSSLCQNTGRLLAPSKTALHASHRFTKGSGVSHVASGNSTTTGKSAAKILMIPSSSQVSAKTSRKAHSRNPQVTSKGGAPDLTRANNASQNKRKQLSTPAALDENNPKRGYVLKSMPQSARSSSDNSPSTAKAPKIAKRMNETKSEFVQNSRSASHVGRRNNMAKSAMNCNEQNRKPQVASARVGSLAGSSTRCSNLTGCPSRTKTKNKPRQERPRWR